MRAGEGDARPADRGRLGGPAAAAGTGARPLRRPRRGALQRAQAAGGMAAGRGARGRAPRRGPVARGGHVHAPRHGRQEGRHDGAAQQRLRRPEGARRQGRAL